MIGRLLRKCDFERTLAMPPCSRSAHFAVHHLPAWPSVRGKPDRKALDGKLCTGDTPHRDQSVDNLVSGLWLGHVVPKRHAARSVTRNMLRRQVRAARDERHRVTARGQFRAEVATHATRTHDCHAHRIHLFLDRPAPC